MNLKFIFFSILLLSCNKNSPSMDLYKDLTPISKTFVKKILEKDTGWLSKRFSDDNSVRFSAGGGHFSNIRANLEASSNLYNILFKVSEDEQIFKDSVSFYSALLNAQSVEECSSQCIIIDPPDFISRIVTVKFNEYVYKISIVCLPRSNDPEKCIFNSFEVDQVR
ncbi:putative lipoprotein [Leptospira wolbachii serovar Codice str. CDC]|uniref:Lipoprotein n=2 Tax=Leptospira TaxID=171 RepID=R9A5M9_9LEPT|nr:putative lipoprotein [Leptospira wolbachii serovar Codice str. CDC]